ncbi:MAG: hypothetical protein LBV67_04905 [Streptococcaceae bacterium]|jgi:5-methylcytosine-specific restriction endonuclease McrA|nr:hypothetical protein [Streptococcaceae bacterium]
MNYLENDHSLESGFRSIYLFGRNTSTYKFALAKTLHELSKANKTFITLEELSTYYAKYLYEHTKTGKKQINMSKSLFLNSFELYDKGNISWEQVMNMTTSKGFKDVLDAFHRLPNVENPHIYFEKVIHNKQKGIVLTDNLFLLNEGNQWENIQEEIEGRWNLVETAFTQKNPKLEVNYDEELQRLFLVKPITNQNFMTSHMRIDLTSARKPLNGYQKGKCFYCFRPISILSGLENTSDIDHFIPFNTQAYSSIVLGKDDLGLNGVWNLVLSCKECNRGSSGKFAHLPQKELLHRLMTRNEYLILSNHPLKETLIMQTGKTKQERAKFIERLYNLSAQRSNSTYRWQPRELFGDSF